MRPPLSTASICLQCLYQCPARPATLTCLDRSLKLPSRQSLNSFLDPARDDVRQYFVKRRKRGDQEQSSKNGQPGTRLEWRRNRQERMQTSRAQSVPLGIGSDSRRTCATPATGFFCFPGGVRNKSSASRRGEWSSDVHRPRRTSAQRALTESLPRTNTNRAHRYPSSHRRAYTSSSTSEDLTPPLDPPEGFVHLSHRQILAIHGPDAAHFLQGITTNNIVSQPPTTSPTGSSTGSLSSPPSGFYAAFLNAPGRILYDTFIYPAAHSRSYRDTWLPDRVRQKYSETDPAFLIEVDGSQLEDLKKHLKRYKLRAKVEIFPLPEDVQVWSAWGEIEGQLHGDSSRPESPSDWSHDLDSFKPDAIGCIDPRAPSMGRRLILDTQTLAQSQADLHIDERRQRNPDLTNSETYPLHRYTNGVAEGPHEIPNAAALPHEYNFDVNGGVDFRKGCYVGQELTIRTQHKGVVRKRVLPVRLSSPIPSVSSLTAGDPNTPNTTPENPQQSTTEVPSADIMPLPQPPAPADGTNSPAQPRRTSKRSAGKLIASLGDVGLAMCRVEMMTDLVVTANGEGGDGVAAPRGDGEGEGFYVRWRGAAAAAAGQEGEHTRIRAFVPGWMRERIVERAGRKSGSARIE